MNEEYSDCFDVADIIKELSDQKKCGLRAIKGVHLMMLIEHCRIKQNDIVMYKHEIEIGYLGKLRRASL
jgi:hypothetical protein